MIPTISPAPLVINIVIRAAFWIKPLWQHHCCAPAHHKLQSDRPQTHDQSNQGNSLNNKGRPRPGQQRLGFSWWMIRLHKWLVPQHKTLSLPLKWLTTLHLNTGTPPPPPPPPHLNCTELHHLSVVKYPDYRCWTQVILQTTVLNRILVLLCV